MAGQQNTLPLAEDGLPKIDVVELATAILLEGSRRETMVSQREVRALAQSVEAFNRALAVASVLIFQVEMVNKMPPSRQLYDSVNFYLRELKKELVSLGMLKGEGGDANDN